LDELLHRTDDQPTQGIVLHDHNVVDLCRPVLSVCCRCTSDAIAYLVMSCPELLADFASLLHYLSVYIATKL
jgi:hypothetical protein